MIVLLWFLQGILCTIFFLVGCAKMFLPKDKLLHSMPVYNNVPLSLVRSLGFAEVLAAVGIVLPALLNIAPFLTTVTAVILAIGMLCAAIVHINRKEYKQIMLPSFLFIAASVVTLLKFFGY